MAAASFGGCHWLAAWGRSWLTTASVGPTPGAAQFRRRSKVVVHRRKQCGPYNHSQLVVHLPMFVCAARSCTRRRTWCRAFLLCLCGSGVFLWCLHGSRAFLCCPRLCVCVCVCVCVRMFGLSVCMVASTFCVILQLGGLASPWCGRCHWLAACRRSWLTTASAGFAKHQRRRHDIIEARGIVHKDGAEHLNELTGNSI